MFVLLGTAKVYCSTIDDTISEILVDPSDVSYISDQVNKEDSVFINIKKIMFSGCILVLSSLMLANQMKMDFTTLNS